MEIYIISGIAEGETELSAYSRAGFMAGIPFYNLIKMSCIIAKGTRIREKRVPEHYSAFGNRIYVVLSEIRTSKKGQKIVAGLGWQTNHDGRGIFVEASGNSVREVRRNLRISLRDVVSLTDFDQISDPNFKISNITCQNKPVSALVAAVYQAEGWGK